MDRTKERPRRATSKEKPEKNLNLVDVYDIAADIGKVQIIQSVLPTLVKLQFVGVRGTDRSPWSGSSHFLDAKSHLCS